MNLELERISKENIQNEVTRKTEVDKFLSLCLNIFQRNWPIVLLLAVLGGAAGMFSTNNTRPYVGRFEILLEPASGDERLTDASAIIGDNPRISAVDYPTQIKILSSPVMHNQIAEKVQENLPNVNKEDILYGLKRNFSVQRVSAGISRFDKTNVLGVSYAATNRRYVMEVLNATTEVFLEYSITERQNNLKSGVTFIDSQIPEIQTKIKSIQNQQQEIQQKYQLIDPTQKGQELFLENNQVKYQIRQTESSIKELEKTLENLSNQVGLTLEEVLILSRLRKNPQFANDLQNLQELQVQLREIENLIAIQSGRFNQNTPMLTTLEDRKNHVIGLIEDKKKIMLTEYNIGLSGDSNLFSLREQSNQDLMIQMLNTQNQIDVLSSRLDSLLANEAKIQQELLNITQIIKEYSELQRQLALTTNTLNQLTLEREKLSVVSAQQDRPWEIITPPEIVSHNIDGSSQTGRVSSEVKRAMGGVVLGTVLGMALAMVIEKTRNTFNKESDVKFSVNEPILGKIPLINLGEDNQENLNNTAEERIIQQAESLKAVKELYTQIYFNSEENNLRSLAICAVEAGDGQAYLTAKLAEVIANSGKKVLIVDANLDYPVMHKYFSVSNEKGLTNLLNDSLPIDSVVQSAEGHQNLFLLSTGSNLEDNQVNLSSKSFQQLMATLEQRYDFVLYYCPLFLESSDASFLANNTQAMLVNIRLKRTSQSLVKKALKKIEAFKLPLLGLVLTY